MLKQRVWFKKDEMMISMSPKEFYIQMFTELLQEINENNKKLKK